MITVITNNQPRDLFALADLPAKAQADFDYIDAGDEHSTRLFQYKGSWYDLHEFTRVQSRGAARFGDHPVDTDSPLRAWDGIQTETFFSGVLVRHIDDGDRVIVGRYYS